MKLYSRNTILMGLMAGSMLGAFAQQVAPPEPLAFKVEWVRPANQDDTKVRYMPVQQNIADPNVIMTFYGKAAKLTGVFGVLRNARNQLIRLVAGEGFEPSTFGL